MNVNDEVYVNWPTGEAGPYTVVSESKNDFFVSIHVENDILSVPKKWCRIVEPNFNLEENRWYICWNKGQVENVKLIATGDAISIKNWDFIERMYRRWDELDRVQQRMFRELAIECPSWRKPPHHVFDYAYRLITGIKQ